MTNCVGVRFRSVGKIYYFIQNDEEINVDDYVVVETIRGIEYGKIVKININVNEEELKTPLKTIIRKATKKDYEDYMANKAKEGEAFNICKEKIKQFNLPMKLLDCEFTLDNAKVLFYFSAENRIDFRDLVKALASIFRMRIELRQVGVRDETKILGGFGVCGRPFCCATYLNNFKPVSIKTVKEQGISLNPSKISGCCGRLMCCLNNESEVYEELNKNLPMIGDTVTTKEGLKGVVYSINTLRQKIVVVVNVDNENKELREYALKDLKFRKRVRINTKEDEDSEIKALEAFEKSDIKADL